MQLRSLNSAVQHFVLFAFDVTDRMSNRCCITVLLHTDWHIARPITVYFFAFTLLIVFCVSAVLWAHA